MATITDIGIATGYRGVSQPKLKNRWRVTFNQIGGPVDSRNMTMQAVSVSRPKLSFDEVEMHRYNSRVWVATKHNWDECSLTVEDDISNGAASVIQAQLESQQMLIASSAGPYLATAPEASRYKFATIIDLLDGGENILETWQLEGCWIKSYDPGELDYSDGGLLQLQLSLRFDHAHQDLPQYVQGLGSALGGNSFL
jgi:hypothetical protein